MLPLLLPDVLVVRLLLARPPEVSSATPPPLPVQAASARQREAMRAVGCSAGAEGVCGFMAGKRWVGHGASCPGQCTGGWPGGVPLPETAEAEAMRIFLVSGARHRGTATGWPDRDERREPAERTVRRGALEGALAESGGRKKMWQISSGAYYDEQKSFSLFPAMLFRVMNLSKYSGLVFV